MSELKIWVHDYRDGDHQKFGQIISPWVSLPHDPPGEDYAGWRAHYGAWIKYRKSGNPPDMIGFFAYRYYLWDPSWFPLSPGSAGVTGAPNWLRVSWPVFNSYREFLATWDGAAIKEQLASCDILQSAPYHLGGGDHGRDLLSDFGASRSANDTQALLEVTKKHGFAEFNRNKIYHWILITHWPIFDRLMREMGPLRLELHDRCKGGGTPDYNKRVMDYVMERVYPLWLIKSGLNFKEVVQLQGG